MLKIFFSEKARMDRICHEKQLLAGIIPGPIILPPETVSVSIYPTSILTVGLLVEISDLCQKKAIYQVTAINGSTITLSFVSNEIGFDGSLGKLTPIFGVGFIPVSTLPPDTNPQIAGIVISGTVVDNVGTVSVIQNSNNPVVGEDVLIFVESPELSQVSRFGLSSIVPVQKPVTQVSTVTLKVSKVTQQGAVAVLTGTTAPIQNTNVVGFTPVIPFTNLTVPIQVEFPRYVYGQAIAQAGVPVSSTVVPVNPGPNPLNLVPFDQILDQTTSQSSVFINPVGTNTIRVNPGNIQFGDYIQFESPPVIEFITTFSINGAPNDGSSFSISGTTINTLGLISPVVFNDSNSNTVTALLQANEILLECSFPFSGNIPGQTVIFEEIIPIGVLTDSVSGSTEGTPITYPTNLTYFLPVQSPIVSVTSNQGISTGFIQTVSPSNLRLISFPSSTSNPNVTYNSGTPLYNGRNVQFNGQAFAGPANLQGNTITASPIPGIYNLPGLGTVVLLCDQTGAVFPIYITGINQMTYTFNSSSPLDLNKSYMMLWANPTLLGWVTADSIGTSSTSTTLTVQYATNGATPLAFPFQNVVQIHNLSYSVVSDDGSTLQLSTPSSAAAAYQYAPILRDQTMFYPGLVAIGNYNGLTFSAPEPLYLNLSPVPGPGQVVNGLLLINGSQQGAYRTSSSDGTFTISFLEVSLPNTPNAPIWITDSIGLSEATFAGYTTGIPLNNFLQVNSGFVLSPTGKYQTFDQTLSPVTFSGTLSGTTLILNRPQNIRLYTPIYWA